MQYTFNISLNENDYFDFNLFNTTKTANAKKQILRMRIVMVIFCLIFALISLLTIDEFYLEYVIGVFLFYVIICVILQLTYKSSIKNTLKLQIKMLKKNGKLPYSSSSILTFDDDKVTEQTETSKNELIYSSIDSIYVDKQKAVYIYINSLAAYIMPINVFASNSHLEEFLTFLQTKNQNIIYDNKQ